MGNILLHKQIIINANIEKPPLKQDLPMMKEWFLDLIESINMKILMGPYLVYSDMKNNEGFTGVTVIETSHLAMHCWTESKPPLLRLDVYTCSDLNIETVFDKLQIFNPYNIEYILLDREEELNIIRKNNYVY